MHVGLVIYGSLDTLSGGYLYDRKLVAHLREQGDTVTILSQPWVNYGRHLLHNFDAKIRTQLLDQENNFDVLLQDELNHPSLFWLNHSHQKRRYPIISIVHHLRCSESHPKWQNALYRQIEHQYLGTVDGFIFNSQTTRQTVFGLTKNIKPHIVALPAGDRFGNASTLPDTSNTFDTPNTFTPSVSAYPLSLRLLFVGNIIPRKGLHVILAALPLCTGAWTLSVIGSDTVEPTYARHLRRQANQLGLGSHIHWLGRYSDEALAGAFRQHDVLIGPSSYEGYGISYLEAMGFGLPVIASTGGAAHEIVTDGVDGYLVDPNDAVALSARINMLTAEPHTRQRLSQAARQRYLRHPTWEQSMAQILTFLKDISR